jgi:Cell Wall Hydrolase
MWSPHANSSRTQLSNAESWSQAVTIALEAERNWALPPGERKEIVPGASHFAALSIAQPSWRNAYHVAKIGDHTFLKVQSLRSQKAKPGQG